MKELASTSQFPKWAVFFYCAFYLLQRYSGLIRLLLVFNINDWKLVIKIHLITIFNLYVLFSKMYMSKDVQNKSLRDWPPLKVTLVWWPKVDGSDPGMMVQEPPKGHCPVNYDTLGSQVSDSPTPHHLENLSSLKTYKHRTNENYIHC